MFRTANCGGEQIPQKKLSTGRSSFSEQLTELVNCVKVMLMFTTTDCGGEQGPGGLKPLNDPLAVQNNRLWW